MNTTNLTLKKSAVTCNGSTYTTYRLTGRFHGARFRKQFTDEAEARGEKLRLEIMAANRANQVRPEVTRLSTEQIADAESCVLRMGGRPLSLAVDWFLATYTAPLNEMRLSEAKKAFMADREKYVRAFALRDYRYTLTAFVKKFPGKYVHEITTDRIIEFLDGRKVGKKRWNNLRGDLHAFFNYCKTLPRRWTKDNPVEPVPTYKITRGLPEILSVEQCEELMKHAEEYRGVGDKQKPGCLAPYFALALFAGIRPNLADGELVRLADEKVWKRVVDLRMGVIRITPEISKTKDLRQIPIRPNLRAWLEKYPPDQYPLIFPNYIPAVTKVRQKFQVGHDVLRHTFISMHVGKYRSLAEAALEAGNSEEITKKHYLNLVHTEDAERFWNICPGETG